MKELPDKKWTGGSSAAALAGCSGLEDRPPTMNYIYNNELLILVTWMNCYLLHEEECNSFEHLIPIEGSEGHVKEKSVQNCHWNGHEAKGIRKRKYG